MKKISILVLALAVLILAPVWANAGTVEGTIQGFTCVTQGKLCPVGKEDPMAALERVFVVLTKGDDYYFVPNVDRAVLARHLNERVKVTGDISPKYPSIEANTIEVYEKGAWKTAWSREWQQEFYNDLYGGAPPGRAPQ